MRGVRGVQFVTLGLADLFYVGLAVVVVLGSYSVGRGFGYLAGYEQAGRDQRKALKQ